MKTKCPDSPLPPFGELAGLRFGEIVRIVVRGEGGNLRDVLPPCAAHPPPPGGAQFLLRNFCRAIFAAGRKGRERIRPHCCSAAFSRTAMRAAYALAVCWEHCLLTRLNAPLISSIRPYFALGRKRFSAFSGSPPSTRRRKLGANG